MEPISTTIAGYAIDKATSAIETIFKKQVIDRWTRHRAQKFFDSFCASIIDASETDAEVNEKLETFFSSEAHSEILFEAYRSVCLTKSRDIGPRIIAFLVAELLISKKEADEDDDAIFSAAEELNDFELAQFLNYVTIQNKNSENKFQQDGSITIKINSQQTMSSFLSQDENSVAPINLNYIGTWAHKLKGIGMLTDDITQHQWRYDVDEENYIDEPGIAREISWFITIEKPAIKLASFVKRATTAS